jgi:cell division protein FtsW
MDSVINSPAIEAPKRRTWRRSSDLWLLATVIALCTLGLLMVYSATFTLSYINFGSDSSIYVKRQATWILVGCVALIVFWRIDYRLFKKFSTRIMAVTLLVLIAIFFIGQTAFGANRWLLAGGSVQPSEAAKIATIIYVAHWASSKKERIETVDMGLIPFGILIGTVCGLILMQPSFSTALLLGSVATTMFFIAGADLKQLLITGLAASVVLYLIAQGAAYRQDRIAAFQDPFGTQDSVGYQTSQVLYALARGGITGEGLGTSHGNLPHLPAGHTDTILAIIGQELGLIVCLIILGLFLFLAYRGFSIARAAPDAFGSVLASGITCWLLYQALFNIAVVTNSIPPTGIALPFISFGGSGMVTALAGIGILLSISRAEAKEATQ